MATLIFINKQKDPHQLIKMRVFLHRVDNLTVLIDNNVREIYISDFTMC